MGSQSLTTASWGHASYRLQSMPARTASPSVRSRGAAERWEAHSLRGERWGSAVAERGVGGPDGPGEAREFVGEGDGGFIMTAPAFELGRPVLQAAPARRLLGVTKNGASAVDPQHAELGITALADGSEAAARAARMLARGQAEIAREVARRGEAMRVADERDERRGGEETDPRNGAQLADERQRRGERGELLLEGADVRFECADLGGARRQPRLLGRSPSADKLTEGHLTGRSRPTPKKTAGLIGKALCATSQT